MSFKVILSSIVIGFFVSVASVEDTRKLISFTPEITKKLKDIVQICQAETGTGEDALDVIRAGKYREDESFQNLVHCSYLKFGALDENGDVITKVAAASFPKELGMLEIIENCTKREGKDRVNKLFEYFKCVQDTAPIRTQLF